MNTYSKFCPNVFVAKCSEQHEKGDLIQVTTKYGKENESEVWNLVGKKDGFYYYSITRADGFNMQERAKAKAARYENWAKSAEQKSTSFYETSKKATEHIPFGQPILVGHHSEARHRRDIAKAWNSMDKCVEFSNKAETHESKAEYWESRASEINLSMPESLEYFEHKLEIAKEYHEGLKSGKYPKRHSYDLAYAKKEVNELEKKVALAKKLWA